MGRSREMDSRGKFGAWLKAQLGSQGLTISEFARLLRISKQAISSHMNMVCKPRYTTVVAYCYILNASPINVWRLVEEDWGLVEENWRY